MRLQLSTPTHSLTPLTPCRRIGPLPSAFGSPSFAWPSLSLAVAMAHISADWLSREFQQNIQYNIMQVATLLNTFDTSTRFKLAQLNEKLSKIERQMEYVEAAIKHVTQPENAEGAANGAASS